MASSPLKQYHEQYTWFHPNLQALKKHEKQRPASSAQVI
jgi:hypothetical protein